MKLLPIYLAVLLYKCKSVVMECFPAEVKVIVPLKYYYHTKFKTECHKICPVNKVLYRRSCIAKCPQFTKPLDNGFVKYCEDFQGQLVCADSFCKNETSLCFEYNCLSSCPEYTVQYKQNCRMDCPRSAPFLTAYACEGVCFEGKKVCTSKCPDSHPYIFRSPSFYHCLHECPEYTSVADGHCNLSCQGETPFLFNRTCLSVCPQTHSSIILKSSKFNQVLQCVKSCEEHMAVYRNVCVSVCPEEAPYNMNFTCVARCEGYQPFYVQEASSTKNTIYYQRCVSACPTNMMVLKTNATCIPRCPHYLFTFNGTCIHRCPSSHPINYTQNDIGRTTFKCVKVCPNGTFNFRNVCFDHCPEQLKHYKSECIKSCPVSHPLVVSNTYTCVVTCPEMYVKNKNQCDKRCPSSKPYIEKSICAESCGLKSSFYLETLEGKRCVKVCPKDWIVIKDSKHCVKKCPEGNVIIDGSCSKRTQCPKETYTESTNLGKKCVESCSPGMFINGRNCVRSCSYDKKISGRTCTTNCPEKKPHLYQNDSKQFCFSTCPSGYVADLSPWNEWRHDERECITEISCANRQLYIYNKTCLKYCPNTMIRHNSTCVAPNSLVLVIAVLFSMSIFIGFVLAYQLGFPFCQNLARWVLQQKQYQKVVSFENESQGTDSENDVHHVAEDNMECHKRNEENEQSVAETEDEEPNTMYLDDGMEVYTANTIQAEHRKREEPPHTSIDLTDLS